MILVPASIPDYEGEAPFARLVSRLSQDEPRCAQVADDVLAAARAGHACLVVSDRKLQCPRLSALFLASPLGKGPRLRQIVGRIMRPRRCAGSRRPGPCREGATSW